MEHYSDWKSNPPSDYEIARLLRTSPRKIRNIRDELSYRDIKHGDKWCRNEIVRILQNAERLQEGKLISFQIDDGLVRDFAQKHVRENWGIVEHGLNSSIAKISGPAFAALVMAVMPEGERQKLIDEIQDETSAKVQEEGPVKTPTRLFVESFAKRAGEKVGKKSV
ncbi:MAG: hypothetical protein OXF88_05400 [Rhodobacteraceae bacterium]|nr:hypothetical protein [Paracoccaceae bacterium]MCY4137789.1 hypothetical protein [Paracoccaceae bacterium]